MREKGNQLLDDVIHVNVEEAKKLVYDGANVNHTNDL